MPESYSGIQDFQRCPQKYNWRHNWRLQRKRRNVNFFWGSEAHGFFQTFCLAIQDGNTVQEARNAVDNHAAVRVRQVEEDPVLFSDEQADARTMIEEAHAMVVRYLDRHWLNDWEVLHVEEQFTYRIDINSTVTFTPDLIIRDRNGNVWIIDWKTTKASVPEVPEVPFEDLQALIYAAGVKEMYPELKGFIFVRLRKKTPTQPRLNLTADKKTGLHFVNNLKNIDTTYEVLHRFIIENAPELLKHPAHALRLAELKENDRFHWTETVIVTDEMIKRAIHDVEGTLLLMDYAQGLDSYYRVYSPSSWDGCKNCEFHSLCQAEVLGWNTEKIMLDEYEERDTSYKDYETEEPF